MTKYNVKITSKLEGIPSFNDYDQPDRTFDTLEDAINYVHENYGEFNLIPEGLNFKFCLPCGNLTRNYIVSIKRVEQVDLPICYINSLLSSDVNDNLKFQILKKRGLLK